MTERIYKNPSPQAAGTRFLAKKWGLSKPQARWMYKQAILRGIPLDEMPLLARKVGGETVKSKVMMEIEMLMEKWDITHTQATNLRHFAIRNGKTAYTIEPVQQRLSAKVDIEQRQKIKSEQHLNAITGLFWKDPTFGWRLISDAYMERLLAESV